MTHDERRKRHKAIAEAVADGIPVGEVCRRFKASAATLRGALIEFAIAIHRRQRQNKLRELLRLCKAKVPVAIAAERVGVSYETGRKHCQAAGIKPVRLARLRERWQPLDWTLRDVDLAKVLGVTRERIRQIRNLLGKDRSPEYHSVASATFRRWARLNPDQLHQHTVKQLTQRFEISVGCCRGALAKMGLKPRPEFLSPTITKDDLASLCQVDPLAGCWKLSEKLKRPKQFRKEYARYRSFRLFNGPIPRSLIVYPKCRNNMCLNPGHLATRRRNEAPQRLPSLEA
jgi:hypothetical protein